MKSATIIIPTLNEEANIDTLLTQLSRISVNNCVLNILFVDDQSTDNTVAKIKKWIKDNTRIKVLERLGTPDLTKSVIDGVACCKSDYILVMDADLSHPIEKIPDLLKPLLTDTHDVVVGSRYIKNGGAANWPIHRRLLSWFGGLPARTLTDVKDTTSGFFACKRSCFEKIAPKARGYKVLLELLVAGLDQFRTTEIPIVFTDRIQGHSKLSKKQLIQYFQRLLELSGGSITAITAKRFLIVGLMGVVVDAVVFYFLLNLSWDVGSAHITSFFVAALSNYFFNSIWSFEYSHQSLRSWAVKAGKYIYFGIIALIVRGGVLAILIDIFNVIPEIAIYPAILSAAIVNYFGASFMVFPQEEKSNQPTLSIYWRIVSVATIAFIIVLRFLYAGTTEIIPDEAYYWNYKQHLDFGYLDHPPLIAWGLWLSTSIFGDNEFGVRLFPLICGLGVIIGIYRLTSLLFDRTSAYIAAFLASVLPFTAATGYFATTDAPQILFWTLCLYFLAKIILHQSSYAWIGVGICIGLGLLSKYSIALLALSIVIYLLVDRNMRRWWKHPITYFSALLALLLFLPVLYWNAQNDWSSFIFQTIRRLDRTNLFSTHYLLLHILILLTPIGVYLYLKPTFNIKSLVSGQDKKLATSYSYFFLVFTLAPFSVYLYYSFNHYPRFHWTAPAWLAMLPLVAYSLSPTSKFLHYKNTIVKTVIYTAGLLCLIYGALLHYAALGLPFNTSTWVTNHYFWKPVAKRLHELENEIKSVSGQTPVVVGLSKWSIASALRFYDQDQKVDNIVSRNSIGRPATMFEQWTQPTQWKDHPVIFVAINPNDLDSEEVKQHSTNLQPPKKEIIYLNNNKLRYFHYRTAESYLP